MKKNNKTKLIFHSSILIYDFDSGKSRLLSSNAGDGFGIENCQDRCYSKEQSLLYLLMALRTSGTSSRLIISERSTQADFNASFCFANVLTFVSSKGEEA